MESIFIFTFWITAGFIVYTWLFYALGLYLLDRIVKLFQANSHWTVETFNISSPKLPSVSVIVAAYNEEKVIARRIQNLLEQDYPKDKMEIIIASDGSTDRTVEIAKEYESRGVKVLDFKENRGRASVHNDAVDVAKGEILVFTDAETEFTKNFLHNMIKKIILCKRVGCVVGNLIYKKKGTSISESEGLYWKLEKKLREYESNIGILATATGACMAARKGLWRDLTPIDDADFTTPLDVILQGFKVTYAHDAIAYDVPPSSMKGELKARIRQTAKNLVGTLRRWGRRGWIKHRFVSWGLLSHKVLRWFTPFFMLGLFISNIFLLKEGSLYQALFGGQITFYILAIVGLIGELFKKRIPLASTLFSFCIANIGMGIGVIKGLIGKVPVAYKMTE